jgi:hypothetical protein
MSFEVLEAATDRWDELVAPEASSADRLAELGGFLTRLSPGEITKVHAEGSVVARFAIDPRT